MEKIQKIISKHILLITLLISIPAVRYLFVYGYFGVSDDLHIGWLYEMDRAVRMLQFPPRYVPDLSYGFGYPLFNFVYPLPFYVAEIFHLLGFSLVNSVKIVFGLSIPLSMYFMYRLLRHFVDEKLSLAGAVLYVYAPYRALELFVRGTIGEIVAFVFFPLIVLSYIKVTTEKSLMWIAIAGLSTVGLVLSHNIMAYMFIPLLILLVGMRVTLLVKDKWQTSKRLFYSLLLGLISSAYFWFPAIYESVLVKYDTVFNFYDHFPTLRQLITPYWGYGASVPGPYGTMSFYMGLVGFFVVVFGSLVFIKNIKNFNLEEKIFITWGGIIFLISIFMMNHRSAFLWQNLPLLPYFQFPWRFLAVITFSFPIFMIAFSKLKSTNLINILSIVVLVSAIVFNFKYFKTSEYLGRGDDYYLNRYIPLGSASEEYKKTSEEYLRLPKDAEVRPDRIYPRAYTEAKGVKLNITELNALDARIETESDADFNLSYSKYFFPGWRAKIDGSETKIVTGKPYGQISVLVPSGKHTVDIKYKESSLRLFFDIVSLIGIGISVYLLFKKK